MDVFTKGGIVMNYGILYRSNGLKLKCLGDGFFSSLESRGLLVDYCDVFFQLIGLSFCTHSLQRIQW